MTRPLAFGLLPLTALALVHAGCASTEKISTEGVPGWLADGATFNYEPEPRKPDAAIQNYEEESGPIQFEVVTDDRSYPDPPERGERDETGPERDPLEPGRDYRIRRLVR